MGRPIVPLFGFALLGSVLLAASNFSAPATEPTPSAAVPAPVPASVRNKRIAVIGIDGLDPEILLETIRKYPEHTTNFQRLIDRGGIHSLGTSCPPQSPVAWSNFITGRNPGGHGIYDFIHRDPITRGPLPGSVKIEHGYTLPLWGEWALPLSGGESPNRSGESFWVTLARNGVPAEIWRMPANFPVEPAEGLSFSGMMTPALDSAYGTYTIYTTNPPVKRERSGGKFVQVREWDGNITDSLAGPPHPYKEHNPLDPELTQLKVELNCYIDRESNAVAIEIGEESVVLQPGQWSDFMTVAFEPLPLGLKSISGVVRFYLRSIEPDFELYASPVNIDPVSPVMPVAEPVSASADLVDAIGYYYTQGMAEEVNALKDGAIDDAEFMTQTRLIYDQRVRMMDHALDLYEEKDGGLFFFYFSSIDLNCHMLWRFHDPDHPQRVLEEVSALIDGDTSRWTGRAGSTWKEIVYDWYMMMDPIIGKVQERLDDDTLLVVMSDHGFASFRRKFSLNRWLVEEGYMVLKPDREYEKEKSEEGYQKVFIMDAVDWSKTRAYGMGFNGLYLNLKGRELDNPKTPEDESGIVEPGAEADALLAEIKAKLEALQDRLDDPILVADLAKDVYSGERVAEAPDMQIGFNAGYGNSDASSTGRIPHDIFADNMGGIFNGNHLMAQSAVAGILMTNGKVRPGKHALEDLTVEILKQYGIAPGEGQDGHPVLE